jgi:hypothetical protein
VGETIRLASQHKTKKLLLQGFSVGRAFLEIILVINAHDWLVINFEAAESLQVICNLT